MGLLKFFVMIRYTAYKKYLYYLNHFSTPKKLLNILENRREYKSGKVRLKSYPYKYTFDPGNVCNLRCPGCHTGIKHAEMVKPAFMKLKDFKYMFDQVKDRAISIALYNWGEPFLNKEIFDIIAYANEQKVGTTLHSNFNHFNESMAEEAVKSGLTHLYLSIDGASQEVYSKYRVKGNIDTVTNNLQIMVDAKRKAKSSLPFVTWKFLKFPHNEFELETAKAKATAIGVSNFEVFDANLKLMDIYDEAADYRKEPQRIEDLTSNCKSLWASIYVGADGTVFPCSLAFRPSESFGNLLSTDFKTIWNNEKYVTSRSMFSDQSKLDNVPLPCKGCKYFLKCSSPSKQLQEILVV